MDFDDTAEEAAFRAEAAAFLKANVPSKEELAPLDNLEAAKLWQKRKYDHGWATIGWPEELGGHGASVIEQVIFGQEEAKCDTPPGVFIIGQGLAAPTMMAWASEEQNKRLLPRISSGEDVWCQLFSEPAGGSDLAALRTKAEKDGDEWIINGQKIWTSGAQHSDYGVLVVRTDPNVPKHKGLTYFFIDMKSPGIEVKPIKQISGGSGFNEVYFTDVRIPDSQRLGAVGQGWQVALTTLMNERAAIGGGGDIAVGIGAGGITSLMALARKVTIDDKPAIQNKQLRAKLADWYVQEAGLKFTGYRSLTALSRGEIPGPENSIGKLVGAPMAQDMASFAIDLLGESGAIWDETLSPEGGLFQSTFMSAPGIRIAGGTDEIMANIIAERVLGLPQEPRLDKGIPFSKVPTSAHP